MSGARTRFAPSPTGSLHVGGVRTALYSLLCARQRGGAFVLRIEDTDRVRSTEEAAQGIVRDLRWLGLYWDEGPERDHPQYGPYYQSQRLELYHRHAEQLVAEDKAYHAWESGAELDAERKVAEAAKENYRYRRRTYTPEQIAAYRAEGRKPVVRLAAPLHAVTVPDLILGEVTVEAGGVDDFVLIKADGFPTYHFAVVIDDHYMDIGLVVRGQEHLMNTHKHLLLYEAFGWTPPEHAHLPLIFNPGGTKMSKRDKAKVARESARNAAKADGRPKDDWGWLAEKTGLDAPAIAKFVGKENDGVATAEAIAKALRVDLPMIEVLDFRKGGYLPDALVNYLCLLGWAPGDDREILTFDEMKAAFSLDRVNKTAARFDADKLLWMNAEYVKRLPEDVLLGHLASWLEVAESPIRALDEAHRRLLIRMYRPRARTWVELDRMARFLFTAPTTHDPKQVAKHLDPDGLLRLRTARGALAGLSAWTPDAIKAALDDLAASSGTPIGKFAQPVRIALTGDGVSPELPETLAFLGQAEALARIDRLLSARQ
jgi:glutamyl-tRNA synthetase